MAQADEIKTLPPQIQPIWPDARWIKRLKKKKVEIRTSLCFLFPGDLRHTDTAPGSARNRYFGIDINESKGGVWVCLCVCAHLGSIAARAHLCAAAASGPHPPASQQLINNI